MVWIAEGFPLGLRKLDLSFENTQVMCAGLIQPSRVPSCPSRVRGAVGPQRAPGLVKTQHPRHQHAPLRHSVFVFCSIVLCPGGYGATPKRKILLSGLHAAPPPPPRQPPERQLHEAAPLASAPVVALPGPASSSRPRAPYFAVFCGIWQACVRKSAVFYGTWR